MLFRDIICCWYKNLQQITPIIVHFQVLKETMSGSSEH